MSKLSEIGINLLEAAAASSESADEKQNVANVDYDLASLTARLDRARKDIFSLNRRLDDLEDILIRY